MFITFYGATREVTGSMFLLSNDSDQILLDCGLFQGKRKESAEKNRVMPFDPGIINNVVLSHAHIDHSGRIPVLIKTGFSGRIITTRATVSACNYLLPDSGHIQESDAEYLNYKLVRSTLSEMRKSRKAKKISSRKLREIKNILKKDRHNLNIEIINSTIQQYGLQGIEPLYTLKDAEESLKYFDGYPHQYPVTIGKNTTVTFYEAGHILGSAMSLLNVKKDGKQFRILHSGDIGRFDNPIIQDPFLNFPEENREIDLLIMESTYGNRVHEPHKDLKPRLKQILSETFQRKGTVLIPAFSFGRTQTLLYILHDIFNEEPSLHVPVYVDSPLATKLTRVFGEHPELYDEETHDTFLEKGQNPFQFPQMHFVRSVEESMALNREDKPQVILSASGMCEAGRILHHLRYKIHNPKNTILIVGFNAQHTLGRRIEELGLAYEKSGRIDEPPIVKILNKEYPLKAKVEKIGGFSAHADKNEMLQFLKQSNLRIKKIALVHGEEEQSIPFADMLNKEGYSTFIPKRGETFQIK